MAGTGKGKGSRPQSSGGESGRSKASSPVTRVATNGRVSPASVSDQVSTVGSSPAPARPRKLFTRKRVIIGGLVALVLLIGGLGFYTWFTINKSLPTLNGTVKMAGLTANVTVTRDSFGVPHIEAANVHDLYMAQGYVHAQDRLYQMFFFRTAGEGRLSELLDPGFVDSDKYLRTVGFRRAAEAELAGMSPEVKAGLEAYAAGVNEFVHTHKDNLPFEFTLLGTGFEDWQPVDSVTFGKLQARDLTETWPQEIIKSDVTAAVGPETAAKLFTSYPANSPVIVPGANSGGLDSTLEGYNRYVRPLFDQWNEGIGSNNWVVDGTKSTTGKPILANDPHLGVRNPSIWYQIHLSTTDGKYDAAGFGFSGAPGIVTGHNKNIAWGVTNVGADVEDLFREKLDEANHPGQYLSGDQWLPLQILTETIKVRNGEPVTQTVRLTKHGPLLSDTNPLSPTGSTTVTGTYSLQWTALQPGHVLEAVYGLQTASNWNEFRAALSKWDVPGQNFVYADQQGNIGYQMTGLVPIRKSGDGSVPGVGWTGENDWTGFIPFDDLPRAYNPDEHFLATANNKNYDDGYKYPFPAYWAKPYRIDRIRELLTAKDKLSVEDMKAVQLDTTSVLARKAAPIMASLTLTETRLKQASDILKDWDGNMKVDSPAAAIYEVTYNKLITTTLSDEGINDNLFLQYLDGYDGEAISAIETLLDKPDDPLWDRKDTAGVEKSDDILLASLTGAVNELTSNLGDNMQEWTWGKIHQIAPRHEFSSAQFVGGLFTLSASPIGGDKTTVAVASYPLPYAGFPLQGPYMVSSHQSYRMILDTSDWANSLGIFGTGESGQPGSKFRENMYQPWVQGIYNPMLYTKQQIDGNKDSVLTLTP
ncbi:MAG: penicillin acylase family protein [Chloroflexota bacterium]